MPSLKRGKNSRAEKIGRRGAEKRGEGRVIAKRKETPEKSGLSP